MLQLKEAKALLDELAPEEGFNASAATASQAPRQAPETIQGKCTAQLTPSDRPVIGRWRPAPRRTDARQGFLVPATAFDAAKQVSW